VILFIPDLSQLTGDKAGQGTGALFAAAMARGEVRMIALATPDVAKKAEEADKLLLSRFTPVAIEPPGIDEAIAILRGIVARYEQAHGVKISDQALTAAVRLARRYVPSAMLPKAAVDLIDEGAARVRVEKDATPAPLDALRRRAFLLRTQLESLADDTDEESQRTFGKLEAELKALEPQLAEKEKSIATSIEASAAVARLTRELAEAKAARDAAAAKGDNARAGELRFGTIPLLEKQLEAAQSALGAAGSMPAVRDRVLESDVADVVAAWTGVPVSRMMQEETQKLLTMEDQLRQRVIGQDPAVAAVSKAVRRGRVGLRDAKKPIGSFLFLGPTGVGKTELAKALAEFLFDDEASLTRLDMSEFMEKHSVARLLGSPPGYVDSEEGGFLTEAVRKRPYSVILFDEMEKAHPDVFNILLQVLDDGRLTDSRGNLAHFADTVIIMTSNVGSAAILEHGEGVTREAIRAQLETELRRHFRPEFLNRIDDTIIFDPLGKKDLRGIVEIQLRGLGRMLGERGVKLVLTDAAKDRLVELGYEPAFGARPVKRVILKNLQDPLAEEMLRGGYVSGDTVKVDANDSGFDFSHERSTK
jgi:ATP-dependent Clp protease ATP-binding subunit ClpB